MSNDKKNNTDDIFENLLFESWRTNCSNIHNKDLFQELGNEKYFLNIENKEKFGLLEIYIYEIINFHLSKKNIIIGDDIFIEFYKMVDSNDTNKFDIDYHKNKTKKEYPTLSCILFSNEETNPILFTNIDLEKYKYKEIPENYYFSISRPNNESHIIYDSSKYHGYLNYITNENSIDKSNIKINVWKNIIIKEPKYYKSIFPCENNINPIFTENTIDIIENNSSKDILEYLFYTKNEIITDIDKILKKYENTIIIKNTVKKEIEFSTLLEKYGNITHDIYPFCISTPFEIIETNRFYNNRIYQNILSIDVCYWIINEALRVNEWDKSNHINYNTCMNLEKIPSVMNFIFYIFNFWTMKLRSTYSMDDENIKINVKDIFISKFSQEKINDIQNIDNAFLVLNIFLSNNQDYHDGEIIFDDNKNEKILIQQGDMLINNGKKMRTKGSVSFGEKYVLVIMIELDI